MNSFSDISNEYIYQDFKELEDIAFRDKIAFYERNLAAINWLPFSQRFEIKLEYATALFNIGNYQKYIPVADQIIYESVDKNLAYFRNKEIYESTLFKKAASFFNTSREAECEHVLKELVKISPKNRDYRQFLFRLYHSQNSKVNKTTRAMSVIFLMCAVLSSAFHILAVSYFFPNLAPGLALIIKSLYISGFGLLVVGEFYHLISCKLKLHKLTKSSRSK